MSKLEELVPPLELCKLIPKGEFEDTYAVRIQITTEIDDVVLGKWTTREDIGTTQVVPRKYALTIIDDLPEYEQYKLIPAPTLEELIKELPLDTVFGKEQHGEIWVVHNHKYHFQEQNGATAALKLWLTLKGIEA